MPVSVVCETTANVNAALREDLFGSSGGGGGSSCSAAANAKVVATDEQANGSSGPTTDDAESLHGKLVASAKRVLFSKIEYEEVTNYGQSVLETLKSKYIVLKPTSGINSNSLENGRSSPATCNNNNNGANGDSSTADANGNGTQSATVNGGTPGKNRPQQNPNELPAPKRILYPRENVRIGWKATGRKWDVGVGMMNVGNTCYLNSTLQALFHVPSMANWLMSDSAHMERCESTDSGCIICAMAKTLQASQNSQSAIRPYFVYSKLKSICKHLVMGRQEDAHEFLRYLVEAMEKSYLSRFRNYKELDQYSKETTPLNQILGGYLKTSVKCLSCQHVSVTFQHFQDLLLDIRKADTIDEALEGYFARERLEDMGYKCEACKKKVSATKQFSLDRAPITLCIQLKRFSMLGTKINKQITIKPRLDLTKFASRKIPGEQLTYRLVAMVTHLGASQHCGHYTAIGLTESGTYYNYDDSYVRPISIQSVCNTNAYIIFYEMDTQPPRQVTSTQVSGAQSTITSNSKEQQPQKVNGHVMGSNTPQRIIGPQLPPGYSNGNVPSSPLANGGNKLILNRNAVSSSPASNSSKIMIHFKNNNSTNTSVKTSAATNSVATSAATSSSSSSTSNNSIFDTLKNSNNNNSNGLHMAGTGKFQESASTKYSLGGPTNKRQINNAKNGNESSSDDDDENEIVSSSTSTYSSNGKATLPSMPRLGGMETNNSTSTSTTTTTTTKPLTNGFMKKSPAPIKSLVPYGSETDDETDIPTTTNTGSSAGCDQQKRLASNPLKRRQSSSSWSSSDNDDPNQNNTATKIKKAVSSTIITTATTSTDTMPHYNGNSSKKSSDTIDEIFNCNKRSNNPNAAATATNGVSSSPKKKSQNHQFTVTSTTHTTESSSSSASNSDSEDTKSSKPQFKRSHSTPPSPPVVKTNSGIWQVTSLNPITACVSPTSEKMPKNPKNPFAASRPTVAMDNTKRPKKDLSNKHFIGNGYQRDSASDSAVSELLKQSHRGYGAPVLTWNGQQSEIERENYDLFDEKRIEDDNHNIDNHNHKNNNNSGNDDIIKIDDIGFDDNLHPPQHDVMEMDDIEEDNSNYPISSPSSPLSQRQRRHHLSIDLKINNNCLPLIENGTNTKEDDCTGDEIAEESTISNTNHISSIIDNNPTTTIPSAATDEQTTVDSSCSSATTATTVINTYCLSPNSIDNEPTTPTLSTTINDIIFHFSEDSLDNL
ncbi:ubiquitin specific peptidase 36 isoform X2 [Haematobia irritans]|uniref:ubiquitin specific peptidase 36 isoform X2 n=1 Tax=Haematobia irritans TaxID=7368 RepID=UPI003F507F15